MSLDTRVGGRARLWVGLWALPAAGRHASVVVNSFRKERKDSFIMGLPTTFRFFTRNAAVRNTCCESYIKDVDVHANVIPI